MLRGQPQTRSPSRDLSQEELAFRAGLHRTAIGLLELGQRGPRMLTLAKLMGGAEASADELMEGIAWVPPSGPGGAFVVSDSHQTFLQVGARRDE